MKLGAGIVVWLGCIVGGLLALQQYAAKAGPSDAPKNAQAFLAAHRKANRPLLIMAIHPRCPCTDASLAELGDLLARSHGSCDALLLQYHPEKSAPDWDEVASNRQLGGTSVGVLLDPGGKMAAALGASTSGHTVVADAHGVWRFAGGLTTSRGHRGRAPAQDAILEILAGREPALTTAPVYGCALIPECTTEFCDP
ncbi:MAG: RedB protein [Opitutaceae bacterium]